jgi:allophanate hydrolase subunit 1
MAAGAIKDTGVQASTTKDAINGLKSAFDRLNGKTIDAAEAEIAWQDSLANATKELKGNNKALSLDTKTGRDHLQVVFDSIKAAQDDAQATLQRTNSSKKARAAFQSDIGTLKQHMIALGFDKGKVQELIAEYGRTPKFEVTKFDAQTAAAQQAASNLANTMDALRQAVIIPVHIEQSGTFHVPGSGVQGQASGTVRRRRAGRGSVNAARS